MSDLPLSKSTPNDSDETNVSSREPTVQTKSADLPPHESGSDASGSDASSSGPKTSSKSGFHGYPFYSPRFWHGMRPATWFRLIRDGRFRFSASRFPHAIGVTIAGPFNALAAGIQWLIFGRKLAAAELHGPPVFIVGHWRSGTTLLHELMVRDERLSSPSTFQCFAPHHFLLTEWIFRRFFSWLLPGKRPMDNMSAGWERPQEDEFAMMNLGAPSPYRRIAFPNEGPVFMDYLDFDQVSEKDKQSWLATLRRFLLTVSVATERPLVIKSPTHTGRIASLAKEFPEARFIHMTRDPRALFPSTRRLWQGLFEAQSLQNPTNENESEYVIECLNRMYGAFERDRVALEPNRLIDVRYEDLTANPVETMQKIYEQLRLSDFETVRPSIQQWASTEHKTYQANRHELSADEEALIKEKWGDYFERYGY